MDPLKYSDMRAIDNWAAFKPDMKGYIAPQELSLWPDCETIRSQIRKFTRPQYMRDNDAPFIALSVAKTFPATRLIIRDEKFAVPISPRDGKFLATHLGNGSASRHTVAAAEVNIGGDATRSSISESLFDALRLLKVVKGDGGREITLETLDLFRAGPHHLSTAPKNKNHFATIFVILPTFSDSADVRLCATHESISSAVQLPKDCSQSASAIGVYAGVSDARIEVGTGGELICLTYHVSVVPHTEGPSVVPRLEHLSGACRRCAMPFACGDICSTLAPRSSDFAHNDATLLCHLAPLVRAYGFKMFIGTLVHTRSTKQDVYHETRSISTTGRNRSLETAHVEDGKGEVRMEGVPHAWRCRRGATGFLAHATEMMKTGHLYKQLMKRGLDEDDDDVEIEDDSCYIAKVIYKHIRSASILFLAA
ncbi:hypothetical protein B0H13DRAFT_2668862 [Mycena leptocephala]|nr:hypothetical protein B0H13DRAFT_2668862 [Mycena leptocephala]